MLSPGQRNISRDTKEPPRNCGGHFKHSCATPRRVGSNAGRLDGRDKEPTHASPPKRPAPANPEFFHFGQIILELQPATIESNRGSRSNPKGTNKSNIALDVERPN